MTRESKLALLIAVTLILLVGVLLSDHLSGATTAELDVVEAPARVVATPIADLPGADDPIDQLPQGVAPQRYADAGDTTGYGAIEPARVSTGLLAEATDPQPEPQPFTVGGEPVVIAQGGQRGGLIENALDGVGGAVDRLRDAQMPTLIGGTTNMFEPVNDRSVTLATGSHIETPVKPLVDPQAVLAPTQGAAPAKTQATTAWKTHKVGEGDTLYRLAARYLGDGNRYPELVRLNSDQLDDADSLRVGMVLKIEAVRVVTQPAPQASATKPAAQPAKASRTYVVLKGDSLGVISQKLLGTVRRMNEIVELNGLRDADDIRVGQTLKIPAK